MNDKPICALDDCERIAWGDERYCRRHLFVQTPEFPPVPPAGNAGTDDGIEIFQPKGRQATTTTPAPAEQTTESE